MSPGLPVIVATLVLTVLGLYRGLVAVPRNRRLSPDLDARELALLRGRSRAVATAVTALLASGRVAVGPSAAEGPGDAGLRFSEAADAPGHPLDAAVLEALRRVPSRHLLGLLVDDAAVAAVLERMERSLRRRGHLWQRWQRLLKVWPCVFAFLSVPVAVAAVMNLPAEATGSLLEASLVLVAATTLGAVLTAGGRYVSRAGAARLRRARREHAALDPGRSFRWDVRDPGSVVTACALFGEGGLPQWRDLRMYETAPAPRRRGGGGGSGDGGGFNFAGAHHGGRESGWGGDGGGDGGGGGGDGGGGGGF
ncbi:TIGR04222 domain-containing membrane protein [Nocardiopsis flavescens]|nr:TIGR04222 domain-containing membrane protein [Nocardiopsis flavescens]